jgi:hypothetical protein
MVYDMLDHVWPPFRPYHLFGSLGIPRLHSN